MKESNKGLESSTETYIRGHINRVQRWIFKFSQILKYRGLVHDKSKLEEPEFSEWKKMDEEPRYLYGSEEYDEKIKRYKYLFEMHWSKNRHHPEYFKITGSPTVDLIDLIEMLCDWLGYRDNITYTEASELVRTQCKRYGFSEELQDLLLNTLSNWFVSFGGVEKPKVPKYKGKTLGSTIDIYV